LNFGSPFNEDYVITSPLGFREAVMGGMEDDMHRGLDLVPISIIKNKKADTQILAVESGTILIVYPPPGTVGYIHGQKVIFKGHPTFGGLVVIKHNDIFYSLYGHFREIWVNEGDKVSKGQPLGLIGTTGQSTGIHLHLEIILDPAYIINTGLANDIINQMKNNPYFIFNNKKN
jgi:murein DD-endopeptidase MepM/ murein hydrolase activator NlpD